MGTTAIADSPDVTYPSLRNLDGRANGETERQGQRRVWRSGGREKGYWKRVRELEA